MFVYKGHLGNLYASEYKLSYSERYCDSCGDYDILVGVAYTRKEAWRLLENFINTKINYKFVTHFINTYWRE